MTTPRRYSHAPISEAMIDLRVELPAETSLQDLERVHQGLENAYPAKKNRMRAQFPGEFGRQGAAASAGSRHIGYVFSSQDGKNIFQARMDGFTLSRLAPYESWEPLRDEARRLWNVYRRTVHPVKVTRLAVRYINRLDLPLPVRELKDYLRTVPEVSGDMPQELAGYFMQLKIPLKDIDSYVLINQAIIEPAKPAVASIVLDIDVIRAEKLPSDEEGVWTLFETLRERKNQLFEACITDQARELFQ